MGSYRCDCKDGFKKQEGNDEKICVDINECLEIPGLCQQKCINYWGSHRCACETGFRLSENNRTCEGETEFKFILRHIRPIQINNDNFFFLQIRH